jgi:processive 1,2-diacylglycerol beta-glucosyltransferase
MNSPRRVLVLTSASGAGHDSQALAFAEWARLLHGGSVEVRIEHLFEDSSRFLRGCVDFYNSIQRRAPWFHHLFYQWTECLGLVNSDSVSFGRGYYRDMLESWRPDVVLSVHDCLNRGYFEEARRVLSGVKCATYCLEFEGGYGFSRSWVNRSADMFLGRTAATAECAARLGLAAEKCVAAGSLLGPRFFCTPPAENERPDWLDKTTGLDGRKFTLLLATGGSGAQNHEAILDRLRGCDVQVVALCGRNEAARMRLEEWHRAHRDFGLCALPFTDEMPELLHACSMIFARAGVTAAEALQCGCPIVFNTIGGVMPQEMPTIRWFRRRGVARAASSAAQLADAVRQWVESPHGFEAWRTQFRGCAIPGHPKEIVTRVLDLVN